jgi:quercetin dioxygenase-like cupin family protein
VRPCVPPQKTREEKAMQMRRSGSQPSGKGPADYFTGTVRIDPLFQAPDPARVSGASVTFEPGARTAWHTHPLGQTLIVTVGCGWAQRAGGPIEEIRPGDVVWFTPGEKHWHGATPTTAMTHIAIQEVLNGKAVDWMEKVSDEQYRALSRRQTAGAFDPIGVQEMQKRGLGRAGGSPMSAQTQPRYKLPVVAQFEFHGRKAVIRSCRLNDAVAPISRQSDFQIPADNLSSIVEMLWAVRLLIIVALNITWPQ